ncbi:MULTISPECIES: hypothetical protein [Pantoea]|uniref:hypothetical protein n=1 Tax=Pantoea TaxID=53335 RepID=UPI0008FD767D|nr:hypothetical protein [Pantoea sp. Ae16]OIX90674.1 hypothetical protein BFS13_10900 [Pantoea sp. Ae16]
MKAQEKGLSRNAVVVTTCATSQGKGIHFCNHALLSGINCNLWFPVAEEESWFQAVERILIMNGLAENLVRLEPLSEWVEYSDWRAIFNVKII